MDIKNKYDKHVNTYMVKELQDVVVDKALGATIYDINGKEYLDCFAGISVVNAGHGNKMIVDAAKKQMDKLVHCCTYVYYSEPPAILAEKLAMITPGKLTKTFFCNSGGEANEGALRIAKQYTGNYEFVALQCSFHGRTNATLSVTGNRKRKQKGGPYVTGIAFTPPPYCYRCPFGLERDNCGLKCAEFVRNTIEFSTAGSVAAFIAEPVMGEGGIIVPPEQYFRKVKEILDEYGVLFIADEVQSGFGRTGKMFAVENYNVVPDIITMAKGIAGGFPLGAFITREEIAASFKPGDHLSTFGGNPVSCAASKANIDFLLQEDIPNKVAVKGKKFMDNIRNELMPKYPMIGDVRGKGLMIGVELITDANKTPAAAAAGKVRQICLDKGLLIGVGGVNGNVLRLQPPLVISEDQLNIALGIIEEVIGTVSKEY